MFERGKVRKASFSQQANVAHPARLGILVVGLSPMNSLPVILVTLVSSAVAHGNGLFAGGQENKQPAAE